MIYLALTFGCWWCVWSLLCTPCSHSAWLCSCAACGKALPPAEHLPTAHRSLMLHFADASLSTSLFEEMVFLCLKLHIHALQFHTLSMSETIYITINSFIKCERYYNWALFRFIHKWLPYLKRHSFEVWNVNFFWHSKLSQTFYFLFKYCKLL